MGLELELEVWRTIGRHIALDESLIRIAAILGRRLPVEVLMVRHLEAEQGRLETVAVASPRPLPEHLPSRTSLGGGAVQRVAAWCREGTIRLAGSGEDPLVDLVVPDGLRGLIVAAPLATAEEPLGVLLVLARTGGRPEGEHRALVRRLVEPCSAALKNHLHLQELGRLREALEADRQALLKRLERDEIVESVVGSEGGLREVMTRVRQVAPTDAPVLLLGDTGTGKEVVARAIHTQSRRASGPMVCVNCGAIPAELVDSELFGHERGSFTGAIGTRKGWFERADGGTLFLDEIGELPPAGQVRLLRILQEGTLERVGAQGSLSVDVRLVAATNADLEQMVAEGRFREDLWYRVGVFPIRLPLLRERREDIPSLASSFAFRAGRRLGGGPLVPSDHDIHLLLAYDWPGNVRELASVIERAAILGGGRRLEVAAALGASAPGPSRAEPQPERAAERLEARDFATLDRAMSRHIERALTVTRGRVEGPHGAARLLGINPHTLRARMRRLGVDWQRFRTR